jgi:hypothetical protein
MSFFATGSDAERVVEYRRRADEMYSHASQANDDDARSFYIEIALAYTGMANHLENRALAEALRLDDAMKAPVSRDTPEDQDPRPGKPH